MGQEDGEGRDRNGEKYVGEIAKGRGLDLKTIKKL